MHAKYSSNTCPHLSTYLRGPKAWFSKVHTHQRPYAVDKSLNSLIAAEGDSVKLDRDTLQDLGATICT